MSTDAIVVLREEHKEIKRLFRSFERADRPAERAKIVRKILDMLALHTHIENEVMYPRVRKAVPDIEDDVLESYEEHHVADLLCSELADMEADAERFVAKTTVLIESVEHHIEEEEQNWFPTVREALGRKELQEIGAEMLAERKRAARKRPASRPARPKLPTQAAAAVRTGDPGLGGAMTELVDVREVAPAAGARTQPTAAGASAGRR